MNIGAWLRASTNQAPLWLLFPEIIDLNTIDFRTSNVQHLCSTLKSTVGQLASCQASRWTLKLFSEDSTNLSGSGTDASRQGSEGFMIGMCIGHKTRTWWGGYQWSVSRQGFLSVWVEDLNDNLVVCFVLQVSYCQTVVRSLRFLKEEELVRSQVTVSALDI